MAASSKFDWQTWLKWGVIVYLAYIFLPTLIALFNSLLSGASNLVTTGSLSDGSSQPTLGAMPIDQTGSSLGTDAADAGSSYTATSGVTTIPTLAPGVSVPVNTGSNPTITINGYTEPATYTAAGQLWPAMIPGQPYVGMPISARGGK